jgi:hypothetical protein
MMKVNMKLLKKHIWLMIDCSTHRVLQEFFDCANVRKYFPELKEKGDNLYNIEILREET